MNDTDTNFPPGILIDIVLVGGPAELSQEIRTRQVDSATHKVKIEYGGGYEHFELEERVPAAEVDDQRVFRWTMRTKIAE